MSITLADWFYEGIIMDGGLLSIDPAYFAITGGRERWLYRVARKHAGGAGPDGFAIAFSTLFSKSGAEGTSRRFKFEILKIARENALPDYYLRIENEASPDPLLRMVRRDAIGMFEASASPAKPAEEGINFKPLSKETISAFRAEFPDENVFAFNGRFARWLRERSLTPDDYQAAFLEFARAQIADAAA